MEQINKFEKIREYLDKISHLTNKLASDITELDLAYLDGYACGIWALLDDIESEMKEEKSMNQIEIYDTSVEINARIVDLTHYFNREKIAHVFGILPFNDKYMLNIYAEGDIMKTGCFECVTKKLQHFSQVVNEIEYMEDNPEYGTRYVIEYDRDTNDYELTYYKREV